MNTEPEAEIGPREEAAGFEIKAIPGHDHALLGVRGSERALFRIQTPAGDSAERSAQRKPLRVAIVLDNSGSMNGQKLAYAKRAVLKLVKHLDTRDTLHFVIYNSNAHVVFQNGDLSEAGKEGLRDQVNRVHANGGTNLLGGLAEAVKVLRAPSEAGSKLIANDDDDVQRIFLFSDGNVTVGVRNPEEICSAVRDWAAAGITTTTFGIGSDFDESLMRRIADEGKGRYAFLASAQDIPKLVSKSVHDLLDLYASNAVLEVRGGMHTIVNRIYGTDADIVEVDDDNDDNRGGHGAAAMPPGKIELGDLHYDNVRQILVELEVCLPGNVEEGVPFSAAEWFLAFHRNGSVTQFSGHLELCPSRNRNLLGDENVMVQAAFAIQRSADLDLRVARLLSHGKREQARDVKNQQITTLTAALHAAQGIGDEENSEVLTRVLERAQRVAVQLNDLEDDCASDAVSVVRRHCVHEMTLNRAMSIAGWRSGCDSDTDGDVANLDDLNGFSPPSSPGTSPPGSPRHSPPGSPPPPRLSAQQGAVQPATRKRSNSRFRGMFRRLRRFVSRTSRT